MLWAKYNTSFVFTMPVMKYDGSGHAGSGDWTPAVSHVKLSKDGAAEANITNVPVWVGGQVKFTIAAAELNNCKTLAGRVDDGSSVQDGFLIQTYGDATESANLQLADVNILDSVDNNMTYFVSMSGASTTSINCDSAVDGSGSTFETTVAADDFNGYWISVKEGKIGKITDTTAWDGSKFTLTISSNANEDLTDAPSDGDKLVVVGRSN